MESEQSVHFQNQISAAVERGGTDVPEPSGIVLILVTFFQLHLLASRLMINGTEVVEFSGARPIRARIRGKSTSQIMLMMMTMQLVNERRSGLPGYAHPYLPGNKNPYGIRHILMTLSWALGLDTSCLEDYYDVLRALFFFFSSHFVRCRKERTPNFH